MPLAYKADELNNIFTTNKSIKKKNFNKKLELHNQSFHT